MHPDFSDQVTWMIRLPRDVANRVIEAANISERPVNDVIVDCLDSFIAALAQEPKA